MKISLVMGLIFFWANSYSQNLTKILEIDSIVKYKEQRSKEYYEDRDTITINMRGSGYVQTNYLLRLFERGKMFKYESILKSQIFNRNLVDEEVDMKTYYYDNDKLIKVNHVSLKGSKPIYYHYYFDDAICIYSSNQNNETENEVRKILETAYILFTTAKE